ncbi:MAG: GH3 auxin-responsive promoter family protein [Candidatus Bathyarchaeota archaeon]|nr:GH3 auxin-responsive promoter family protein [Candidatus Bathyarchaeota archaeon]
MILPEIENVNDILKPILGPWYESLNNPNKAQQQTLFDLLKKYSSTDYGKQHKAAQITSLRDYQTNFPVIDYPTILPYLAQIKSGNYQTFLSEPPSCWVMTRGSTGKSKVLPATQTHLKQIFSCGARALVHYAVQKQNFNVFTGNILNLNFPSSVHVIDKDGKKEIYGYSSGTYARLNPMFDRVSLLPRQEDIDALGSDISRTGWEKRFELAYQQAIDKNVTATMGVTPVILAFARYVQRKHGKKPADLWKLQAMFCTSVPKIQFKYAPILRKYFGQVPVIEMYTATEGVFAQQYDYLPYVTPNYDTYVFEVVTNKGVKILHELKRGEWGRLIISSCMLPRYDIGDMVEAAGKNYFRIFGRRKTLTLLEHRLYRLFLGWLL